MTDQQKGIITLIRSALDGKSYALPEAFDMEGAVHTAMRHKIIALVYYGALNCGVDKKSAPMQMLFQYVISTMNVVQRQCYEANRIREAFCENGLDHMFMKGSRLQQHYPKPEMRTMGDLDILIRIEQYPQIEKVMTTLGYTYMYESDHELVWKRGKITVELHKRIMTTYNPDLYSFWGDGWQFSKEFSPNEYMQKNEDFYLYIFVHMTKHYRISGIGIKHFVDLWLYRSKFQNLDERYIDNGLKKLRLDEFYTNIMRTLDCWFAMGETDSVTDYITEFVFESGEYGLAKTASAARILREAKVTGSLSKAKRSNFWRKVFLPYRQMLIKYRTLKYLPFLLPVYWVVRLCSVALFKRKKVSRYLKEKKGYDKNIQNHMEALHFVGLDFYTQEQLEK